MDRCPNEAALQEFADGRQTPAEAEAFESHVHSCEHCRAFVSVILETRHEHDGVGSDVDPARRELAVKLLRAFGGPRPARAERPPPELPGFEVRERLGAGGMGTVYKARQKSLDRLVALKFLPRDLASNLDALARFRREARAASSLNHPNICTIFDLGEVDGQPFFTMELVQGMTLGARLREKPTFTEATALIRQIAQALAAAHTAGIVHRDIKPENVMVRDDGIVKVVDFGLARLTDKEVHASDANEPNTATGIVLGTFRYMSPEQLRGEATGAASDVFSLGIVWYQAITQHHPFTAETLAHTLQAIQFHPPPAPSVFNPDVPPHVDALIGAMLGKASSERPTMEAVCRTIDGLSMPKPALAATIRLVVGRQNELSALWTALGSALQGKGSLLAVSGESGIGKTTLVEEFLSEVAARDAAAYIADGRCVENLEGTEAYLPILEMLENLLRGPKGSGVAQLMRRLAPSWYAQCAPAIGNLRAAFPATSPERRKRELCVLLEALGEDGPVVLFLDDLHWADNATIDLLSHLAAQLGSMKLLVVVSVRMSELHFRNHPFLAVHKDMLSRGVCREVVPGPFTQGDVDRYLAAVFPGHHFPAKLAQTIHGRAEGNPFFTAELVRFLRDQNDLRDDSEGWGMASSVSEDLPESVRSLIARQIDRLSEPDERLLRAASVQGNEFDSAILARALGLDRGDVEGRLSDIARVHSLVRSRGEGELPDGTLTLRFQFTHALFQNAFHALLPPTRRAQVSGAVADALIAHFGGSVAQVATPVALLLETARDAARAAPYFVMAAANALRVYAYREAEMLARRGLSQVAKIADARERARTELELLLPLDLALRATHGFTTPELPEVHRRARAICGELEANARLAPFLFSIVLFHLHKGEVDASREVVAQLRSVSERANDPTSVVSAHILAATTLLHAGRPRLATVEFEDALGKATPEVSDAHEAWSGVRPTDVGTNYALGLWLSGYPDRALRQVDETLELVKHRPSLGAVNGWVFAAILHEVAGSSAERVQGFVEKAQRSAREIELPFHEALVEPWYGWSLAKQGRLEEGLAALHRGLATKRAIGSVLFDPHILLLRADVLAMAGRLSEAWDAVEEAKAALVQTGDRYFESEVHRWEGVLGARLGLPPERVNESFHRAQRVARDQGATLLALRAIVSWEHHGTPATAEREASSVLAELDAGLTEGFEAPDVIATRGLLRRWRQQIR